VCKPAYSEQAMRKAEAASLAGAAFAWTARHSAVLPGVRMPTRRDLETTTEKETP